MHKFYFLPSLILVVLINACAFSKQNLNIEVQGHRGCRGILPENTLPAFEAAILDDADILEMDLAVTKDGVLVISHDPHINPEICVDAKNRKIEKAPLIRDLLLSEVKSFDCGVIKNPRFEKQIPMPGTKIPTLSEVFALVRQSTAKNAQKIGFNIETKIFPDHPEFTVGPQEFTELVVKAFRESGFIERITLQSFDPRVLVLAKAMEPSLKTVLLVEDSKIDMIELAKQIGAFAVSPDFKLLSRNLVTDLHQHNFKVIPWTVNSVEDWKNVIELGVDGIITDYPGALRNFLMGLRECAR